jgi:phenylacetate-coenzyme A ligase PaaK-like adenylate-forming protein
MSSPATAICKTPLESWIAQRMTQGPGTLTRAAVSKYQMETLRDSVRRAREHSPFYSHHLREIDERLLHSVDDLHRIPFTTAADICGNSLRFLCVSQDEIHRVVTLASSGTSGNPKRLFFTAADHERTLEFFEHGVSTLAHSGDKMFIALPGERHGSVGNLLAQGVQRSGITPIPYGLISNPADALEIMDHEQATSIIGFPVQVLWLANQVGRLADRVFSKLRSIVLCSDYVPVAIIHSLQRRAGCGVFEHYGMTEMGLGGGVDCVAHSGYHLREADLLFEIVDTKTGEPLSDGEIGEVVFSTLTREGMPLIRYKTGDLSCFSVKPCACGSVLRTLQRIRERVDSRISLGNCGDITMADLDDALFEVPGLNNFSATLTRGKVAELGILVQVQSTEERSAIEFAHRELEQRVGAIERGKASGELQIVVETTPIPFTFQGAKRKLEVRVAQ